MENILIIALLMVALGLALRRVGKHFRGGCCGSGGTTIREKKVLAEPVIQKKLLQIAGMKCENCQIRVENGLNRLDGVLCRVNLRRGTAEVSMTKEVPDALLTATVERLGYQVNSIESMR